MESALRFHNHVPQLGRETLVFWHPENSLTDTSAPVSHAKGYLFNS